MSTKGLSYICMSAVCAAITVAPASSDIANAAGQAAPINRTQSMASFKEANQLSSFAQTHEGRITRVYGKAFSTGTSTANSAQSFLNQHASIWGVSQSELIAEGPFADGAHTQQIGYLPESDSYKFTGHYYKQVKQGIPVYQSKLVLLVRNEANHPLVLASADIHDLSSFEMEPQQLRLAYNEGQLTKSAQASFQTNDILVMSSDRMIFAGANGVSHAPTLADVSEILVDGFERFIVVSDANTGAILHSETRIHTIDIVGNASAMASEGPAADFCAVETVQPLPYLEVGVQGGNSVFADENGDFTIPHGGASSVNVDATLAGQWFEVFDFLGSVEDQTVGATPPGPVNFLFNEFNNDEATRAQVNAYVAANEVRDFAVRANPSFPTLMNESFPIWVNRTDGFCPGNAWYDPGDESINFCLSSGSSTPNTAWTSVVQHEYGHHLVNAGGSGQGQYGEGTGDVMSVIILDNPTLGIGFFGSCGGGLRDADNSFEYPCNTGSHACAPLYSGCVWDTRNELVVTEPDDYTEILNFLAVNSILVHSGSDITPQMTIDWLTLDDDDSDIGNGTPHYNEIAAGFGAHGMDAPALTLVAVAYPDEQPEVVSPNGTTTMRVQFQEIGAQIDESSPTLMVNTGSGFSPFPMSMTGTNEYLASFPSSDCGSELQYYVSVETDGGVTQTSPSNAPDASFSTTAAFGAPVQIFADNFQSNLGWSVSGDATDGQWTRGFPVNCNRGDPDSDFDGSGNAYLTDNSAASSCNSDVDGGTTILTSPVMDASEGSTILSYARWYDNTAGSAASADTMVIEISDDNGASWVNLENVGPGGAQASGGWYTVQFQLDDIPGFLPTDEVRVRFSVSDLGEGSVVEAGIDDVKLQSFDCNACIADLNGDGALNFFDISTFLDLFGTGDLAVDLNGDGALNFFDVSEYLGLFGAGCP